eukprot:gene9234-16382_t
MEKQRQIVKMKCSSLYGALMLESCSADTQTDTDITALENSGASSTSGRLPGVGIDPVFSRRSGLYNAVIANQPYDWYNSSSESGQVNQFEVPFGFFPEPMPGFPDGYPTFFDVNLDADRAQWLLKYIAQGAYLTKDETSSMSARIVTYSGPLQLYGYVRLLFQWVEGGRVKCTFFIKALEFKDYTFEGLGYPVMAGRFIVDVVLVLIVTWYCCMAAVDIWISIRHEFRSGRMQRIFRKLGVDYQEAIEGATEDADNEVVYEVDYGLIKGGSTTLACGWIPGGKDKSKDKDKDKGPAISFLGKKVFGLQAEHYRAKMTPFWVMYELILCTCMIAAVSLLLYYAVNVSATMPNVKHYAVYDASSFAPAHPFMLHRNEQASDTHPPGTAGQWMLDEDREGLTKIAETHNNLEHMYDIQLWYGILQGLSLTLAMIRVMVQTSFQVKLSVISGTIAMSLPDIAVFGVTAVCICMPLSVLYCIIYGTEFEEANNINEACTFVFKAMFLGVWDDPALDGNFIDLLEEANDNDSAFSQNVRDDLSSILMKTAMAAAAKSRTKSTSTLPKIGAAKVMKMWKTKRGGGGDSVQLGAASFVAPGANKGHSISSNGDSASLNLDSTSQTVDAVSMQMVASQVMSRLGMQAGNMDKEKKSYMNDNSTMKGRSLSHLGSGHYWTSAPLASGGQQLLGQRSMARNTSLSGPDVSYSADLPGGRPHPVSSWQRLQLSKLSSITRQPESAAERAIASIDAEADAEANAEAHRKQVRSFLGAKANGLASTRKGRSMKMSMAKPTTEELDTGDEVQQAHALLVSTFSGVGRARTETLFKLHASKVAQSPSQSFSVPLALNSLQSENESSSKLPDSASPRRKTPKARDSNAWSKVGASQDSGLAVKNCGNSFAFGGGSGVWNAHTTGKAFSAFGQSPPASPLRNLTEVEESGSGTGPSLLSKTFGSKGRVSFSGARLASISPDDNIESVIRVNPRASLSIAAKGRGSLSSGQVEIRVPARLSLSTLRVGSPTGLSYESSEVLSLRAPGSPMRHSLKSSHPSGQVNSVAPDRPLKSSLKPGFLKGSSKLGPQGSPTGSSSPVPAASSELASTLDSGLRKNTIRKAATAALMSLSRENSDPYLADGSTEAQATALLTQISSFGRSRSVAPRRDLNSPGNDSLDKVLQEMNRSAGKKWLPAEYCPRPNLDVLKAQLDPSGSSGRRPGSGLGSQSQEMNNAAGNQWLPGEYFPYPSLDALMAQLDPSGSSARQSVSGLGSQGQDILKVPAPRIFTLPTPRITPRESSRAPQIITLPTPRITLRESSRAKPGSLPNSRLSTPTTFSDITLFHEPGEPQLPASTPFKHAPGQPLPTFTDIREVAFNVAQDVTCLANDMKAANEGLQEMLRQMGELLAMKHGALPSSVPHPQHASAASLPVIQHNWNPHAPMEDDSPSMGDGASSVLSHGMRLSQSTIDISNVFMNVPSERILDYISGSRGRRNSLSYSRKLADVERAIMDMDSDYAQLSSRNLMHMDVTDVLSDMIAPSFDSKAGAYSGKLSPRPDAAPKDGFVRPMIQNVDSIPRRGIIPFASRSHRSSPPGGQAAADAGKASMSSRKNSDASGNEPFSVAVHSRARKPSALEATVSSLALFGTPTPGSEAVVMTEHRKPRRRSSLDEPATSLLLHGAPKKNFSLKALTANPAHQHLDYRTETS